MTTETTTASIVLSDRTLLGLLALWERDGRCPLPLVDYLEETRYPGTDFVKWAAQEPDRLGIGGEWGGVRPFNAYTTVHVWETGARHLSRSTIPARVYGLFADFRHPSFAAAVVAVLLVWPEGWMPTAEEVA